MSQDFTFTLVHQKGCFLDVVDDDWLKDELPNDDIIIPQADQNGDDLEEIKKPEKSWADISEALSH